VNPAAKEDAVAAAGGRIRSGAASKIMDLIGLSKPGATKACTVLKDGEAFTVYALTADAIHCLKGKNEPLAAPGKPALGEPATPSACDYTVLPITRTARFSLTITRGINEAPENHVLTFHLGGDGEPLILKARPGEKAPDDPLVFAEALARVISKRSGRTAKAREATPIDHT
jgi:hypothetical protein